jgi:hypothetical protein
MLVSCIGVASMIAFVLLFPGRAGDQPEPATTDTVAQATPAQSTGVVPTSAAQPGAPLGAAGLVRCADGAIRFPGAESPEQAAVGALRALGADVDDPNSPTARYARDSGRQIVGGWIAISLLAEQDGEPAPTLSEWLGTAPDGQNLTSLLLTGRTLDTLLTVEDWDEIQSWPPNTCGGAFVHNPRNATLMALVEGVVAP